MLMEWETGLDTFDEFGFPEICSNFSLKSSGMSHPSIRIIDERLIPNAAGIDAKRFDPPLYSRQ
jgi:hypothetical protein